MSERSNGSKRASRAAIGFAVALLMIVGVGWFIWPPAPDTLGADNGVLAPCPGSPNCVHTGLRHPEGTQGMFIEGRIVRSEMMPRILEVVEAMPRTRVITSTDTYLHAEVRSQLFRFIDDLELLILTDRELVVRSASRVGRGDMGVNAARVEELRGLLQEAGVIR